MNENIVCGIKSIFLKVILPFIAINLVLGLVFAFFLGSIDYIAHGTMDKTWSFVIEKAGGTITTNQKIIGGILCSCLFSINQLFVIIAMLCLRKRSSKYTPMRFAVVSSAVVGGIIGLLIGLATPSGLEIHYSEGNIASISAEIGKSVAYQGPIILACDFIVRIILASIMCIALALVYSLAGLILAPVNGLRNLADNIR